MSQENVELVRSGYEAFDRGDIDWIVEHVSPDVVFNLRGARAPDLPSTIRGKDGLRELFRWWFVAPWEKGLRQDIERLYDLRNRVLGLIAFRGNDGKESGIDVELPYAHIFSLRRRPCHPHRGLLRLREGDGIRRFGLRARWGVQNVRGSWSENASWTEIPALHGSGTNRQRSRFSREAAL